MVTSLLGNGPAVAAFDIGGTDIKAALFDRGGVKRLTIRRATITSTDGTATAAIGQLHGLWEELLAASPDVTPDGVGLVVPGLVDDDAGICVRSENLGWIDAHVRTQMQELTPVPVSFGHDVRAAGTAERRLGAARDFSDCVVIAIGTGIACAIYTGGQPYSADGFAGEIGHLIIDPRGEVCLCGARGCLEAIASAGAIARRYSTLANTEIRGAREVLARAADGDAAAIMVWESALDALALGLSHVVGVLAPEAIIVGGGLAQAGAALFEPLSARLVDLIPTQRHPVLLPAAVGEDAALFGAALGARDLIERR